MNESVWHLARIPSQLPFRRTAVPLTDKEPNVSAHSPTSILFVDDNDQACTGLVRALRQEGFHVLKASTGCEALRLLEVNPSLVILDVYLPDLSGFEVCRRIKSDPNTASICVLHLSGHYVSSEDRSEGLEGGADGYLVKPVSPRELIAHVRALLRIRQAEKALCDSEALYHSLVETLPVSLFRQDREGRFVFANQPFCAQRKQPLADIVGKTVADLYPPDLAERYLRVDRQVIETGEVFEDIEKHPGDDGGKNYLHVLKVPLRDSSQAVIGMQGICWDITDRKRAEEELARTAAEFRVARRIQQKLFPTDTPTIAGMDIGSATYGFDIGGASYPAEAIGGDYYDYLPLVDGNLGIAIGDVSGHGVGPALLMAEVRAYLRAFALTHAEPGEILGFVNRVILPDIEGDRFITLLLARLDPRRRIFVYSSAGHSTGYVFNAAGEIKQPLPSTSIPLGIQIEGDFPSSAAIALETGDLVLFLTDGIVEARSPDGAIFGTRRTIDLVRHYRRSSARQIVENLYYAVRAYAQNQPQYDDITATVIKVGPAA
jgi:PAS domain S-box-containing protein